MLTVTQEVQSQGVDLTLTSAETPLANGFKLGWFLIDVVRAVPGLLTYLGTWTVGFLFIPLCSILCGFSFALLPRSIIQLPVV